MESNMGVKPCSRREPLIIHLAYCSLVPATAKALHQAAKWMAVLEVCVAIRRVSKAMSGSSSPENLLVLKISKDGAFMHLLAYLFQCLTHSSVKSFSVG